MQQTGEVISSTAQSAQVRIVQNSACASCGKCSMGHESRSMVVSARNLVAARPGDRVILSMSEHAVLQAGLLVYALPLVALFIGAFTGQLFAGQAGALLGGFGALALSYLLLHYFLEPRLEQGSKFSIAIVQVIDEEEEANSCVRDNSYNQQF